MTGVSPWHRGLGVLALVVCSKVAPAQSPDPSAQPEQKPKVESTELHTPAKKPQSLPYRHDGFFLRVAVGGAYSWGSGSVYTEGDTLEGRFDLGGGGLTLQLAMGGTLANGLVVGGLIHSASAWSPTYEFEHGPVIEGGSAGQGVLGPFVDYYFDPEAGFHVQFAAPLALVILEQEPERRFPTENVQSVYALGAMVGTGYEFFVGPELAMGLLVAFHFTTGNLAGRNTRGDIVTTGLGALLSVTHH
jgi:hypothetical protein